MRISLVALVFIGIVLQLSTWAGQRDPAALRVLAEEVMALDDASGKAAIAQLREAGPAGLDALFTIHAAGIRALQDGKTSSALAQLRAAIESVSGQRDCHASHLYWFTDFTQARAAARESGKPILSLRLLGRLDEEFSCANSRFFRTTLYANEEIAAYLRDHFILHWKSVRPVPKITIDFGDGRVVQRTITGNSIHYALDAEGTVIDALPGLYTPRAFLDWLKKTGRVAQAAGNLKEPTRAKFLCEYHTERRRVVERDWRNDLRAIGARPVALTADAAALSAGPVAAARSDAGRATFTQAAAAPSLPAAPPTALAAAKLAVSKGVVELKMLRAAAPGGTSAPVAATSAALDSSASDAQWKQIAALHSSETGLDPGSIALMRAKSMPVDRSGAVASEAKLDAPLLRTLRNFERSVAEDTVRNEYLLHTRLHEWLATAPSRNVDTLNARVYDELFLTPDSDPWLGLLPPDTFTALENDGRR